MYTVIPFIMTMHSSQYPVFDSYDEALEYAECNYCLCGYRIEDENGDEW